MKIPSVTASSLGLVLVVALASPASAQTGPATPAASAAVTSPSADGDSKGDVDAAVSIFNRVRNRGVTNTYKTGFHVGASFRVAHVINVVGEFNGSYHKLSGYTANIYEYAGGVRFESGAKGERVKPFAQILLGGAQDNGTGDGTINHYPVVDPGFGADLRLAPHIAARVRYDFPLYATFGDVFKGSRLSIGVACPLGSR